MQAELTGQMIVSRLRTRKGWEAFGYGILTLPFLAMFIFVLCDLFTSGNFAMDIVAGLISGVCIFFFVKKGLHTLKIALNPRKATVFRKYGDPDEIADRIHKGLESILLEQREVVVTEEYILRRKHYETFVPLADIMLMYRKEHRTYGMLDSISLIVHDRYGEQYEYPFTLKKKNASDMDYVAGEITKRTPDCICGYDSANLAYVKEHQVPIPE